MHALPPSQQTLSCCSSTKRPYHTSEVWLLHCFDELVNYSILLRPVLMQIIASGNLLNLVTLLVRATLQGKIYLSISFFALLDAYRQPRATRAVGLFPNRPSCITPTTFLNDWPPRTLVFDVAGNNTYTETVDRPNIEMPALGKSLRTTRQHIPLVSCQLFTLFI